LCGGTALEPIEYRRQDPAYLDMFVLCPHSNEASPPIIRRRSRRDRHSPKKLSKHWKNIAFPIRRRRAIFAVGIRRSRSMPCRIRYFFYLTNDRKQSAAEIVFESNARCNQENLIGNARALHPGSTLPRRRENPLALLAGIFRSTMPLQNMKSKKALRMPPDNLNSNWLSLVAACLAWSLKSWSALWLAADGRKREEKRRQERLIKMEFATFLQAMIALPVQIIHSGRQTIVRLLSVNDWTATFFRLVEKLRPVKYARRE